MKCFNFIIISLLNRSSSEGYLQVHNLFNSPIGGLCYTPFGVKIIGAMLGHCESLQDQDNMYYGKPLGSR
jgi:hypothetical protein